jgi:hypothetical protein
MPETASHWPMILAGGLALLGLGVTSQRWR